MRSQKVFIFILFCLIGTFSFSQSGAWNPPGADLTYPRTLFKTSEIPAIQQHLLNYPPAYVIYEEIWQEAISKSPKAPASPAARRYNGATAKNCGMIALLNVKPNGSGGLDTLTIAERDTLINRGIRWIELLDPSVTAYPNSDDYLYRSHEVTLYAQGYDLLKGLSLPDSLLQNAKSKLVQFTSNLYRETTFELFGIGFFTTRYNNHGIRSASGLAIAGLVLNDHTSTNTNEQPSNWINAGMYNIEEILFVNSGSQSIPNMLSGYAEGPHYLKFGFKNMLPLIHAFGNFLPDTSLSYTYKGKSATIQNPWYDDRYDYIFEWITRIRMPDGRMPHIEDSFVDEGMPELAIMENPDWLWDVHYSKMFYRHEASLSRQLTSSNDDLRADFVASQTVPNPSTFNHFQILKDAGNVVFRSGWDSTSLYFHLNGESGKLRENGRGHNHGDATSFMLMYDREVLALDPGYVKWDRKSEVDGPTSHNLVLVDGTGPLEGAIGFGRDADVTLQNEVLIDSIEYIEAKSDYANANQIRKVLFPRRNYILVADELWDNSSHAYTWQCHGYGLEGGDSLHGTFKDELSKGGGTFTRNDANLLVRTGVGMNAGTYGKPTAVHEWYYDSVQVHNNLTLEAAGNEVAFLSCLYPYKTDTPTVNVINGEAGGVLLIQSKGYTDLATHYSYPQAPLALNASTTGFTDLVKTDGKFSFWGFEDGVGLDMYLMQEGSNLDFGTDRLFACNGPCNLALKKRSSDRWDGDYKGTGGQVELYFDAFTPGWVRGPGVNSWSYNSTTNKITVDFSGDSEFQILLQTSRQEEFKGNALKIYPVPASNQFSIQYDGFWKPKKVVVYDILGLKKIEKEFFSDPFIVNCFGLSNGIYLVEVELENGEKLSRKVIVNRRF